MLIFSCVTSPSPPPPTLPPLSPPSLPPYPNTLNPTQKNTVGSSSASAADGSGRGKMWSAGYTLRSHFDSVRCLVFHPTEHMLITGSEDHTLKLWNLQKTITTKKFQFQLPLYLIFLKLSSLFFLINTPACMIYKSIISN